MSISASQIVQVNPRLLTAGGTDLEFNGLILSTSAYIPASQLVLPFADAESVGDYFGLQSQEYQAAVVYFMGYNNSFKKPRALYIAKRVAADVSAFVRGAAITQTVGAKLAELKQITNGTIMMTIDGNEVNTAGVNFSQATSLSNAGEILANSINMGNLSGVTVTYDAVQKAFTVTSGTTGENSSITAAQGTVADAMNLTVTAGAVVSQGMNALTPTENMEAILDLTTNFVCFTTVAQATQADTLEYAAWAAGKGVNYLYVFHDMDARLLQPNNTDTIAAALTEANAGATAGVYGDLRYAAMILGTAASIDWDRRQGTITFAFKAQDGLPATVTTSADATNLKAQNMNFMGDYATRNDNFIFMYEGKMFGSWTWIDTYLNAVWLNNALQVACMSGFENCPRVPYNDEGYALVRSWLQDPVNRGLYNGVIDTGVALSQSQIAQLAREAGQDISKELNTDGYYIKVGYDEEAASTEASVRQRRDSPEVGIWYCYGGSIHRLNIASTAVV